MSDARTRYLQFLSRLYELASHFPPKELSAFKRFADAHSENIPAAIAHQLSMLPPESQPRDRPRSTREAGAGTTNFSTILSSKELFPRVENIADFVSPFAAVHPRPKEGRDRFCRRVAESIRDLPEDRRHAFNDALTRKVEASGAGFVSRWAKVIRDL